MVEWRIARQGEKDMSGCGTVGIMSEEEIACSGEAITTAICAMIERGNGLGAGFAAYGIYPDLRGHWCFHSMYQEQTGSRGEGDSIVKVFRLSDCNPAYPARGGMGHLADFPVN